MRLLLNYRKILNILLTFKIFKTFFFSKNTLKNKHIQLKSYYLENFTQ